MLFVLQKSDFKQRLLLLLYHPWTIFNNSIFYSYSFLLYLPCRILCMPSSGTFSFCGSTSFLKGTLIKVWGGQFVFVNSDPELDNKYCFQIWMDHLFMDELAYAQNVLHRQLIHPYTITRFTHTQREYKYFASFRWADPYWDRLSANQLRNIFLWPILSSTKYKSYHARQCNLLVSYNLE